GASRAADRSGRSSCFAATGRIMTRWTPVAAYRRARSRQETARSRGGWMATQGESAALILAAGTGPRMRADTPKVLHPLAGRSMLAHSLHSIAKMAPQHVVVVLGQDHGRIEQVVGELANTLGRSIDVAIQDRQLGTGHAVLCGLSALPDDFAGVVV